LSYPEAVAYDAAGDLYIADAGNNVIREVNAVTGVITTVAGDGSDDYSGDGGPATDATLDEPYSVAIDAAGDIYISDYGNKVIREVNAITHDISTIAGDGTDGDTGDGGQATDAEIGRPLGITLDAAGDLYIAVGEYNVIRMVAPDGIISTAAGTGTAGYPGNGGQATAAKLDDPIDVAVDAGGNLFIADRLNNVIREVAPNGIITNFAGEGPTDGGYSGDGGPATAAMLNGPVAVAVGAAGTLYIEDGNNNVIRMVTLSGVISTVAGTGVASYTGDGGAAINATFGYITGMTVTSSGDLVVADTDNNVIREIAPTLPFNVSKATPTVSLSTTPSPGVLGESQTFTATVTGPNGGTVTGIVQFGYINSSGMIVNLGTGAVGAVTPGVATYTFNTAMPLGAYQIVAQYLGDAHFNPASLPLSPSSTIVSLHPSTLPSALAAGGPQSIVFDASGNAYILDTNASEVLKVTPAGVVSDYAGSFYSSGYSGNGGQATAAQLSSPFGLAIDAEGNLYIADTNNNVVRVVNAQTGIITNFAGDHTQGYTGNGGLATAAELENPEGVAVDSNGDVFISDSGNNVIREVTTNGLITTVAGNGTSGYSGNGGQATAAEMNNPVGLTVDASGNIYVAERFNNVIRMIAPDGIISTVAGDGTSGYSGDGGQATAAELGNPFDVAVDAFGNLYIADSNNNVIREVSAITGDISTIAGTPEVYGFSGNGGPASSATLNTPRGVGFDSAGDLYIADTGNNLIREVIASASFDVVPQPPAVSGISPNAGPVAGGTTITIAGTSLANATAVNFGSNVVTDFISDTANEIVLYDPAGTLGTVNVTVTTAGGTSGSTLVNQFTYANPPTSYVVTNTDYDPETVGSLAYEIGQATYWGAANPVITFALPLDSTISLTAGDIDTTDYGPTAYVIGAGGTGVNITINGAGSPGLVIDGNGVIRPFAVYSDSSLTLENLTVSGGEATGGAGGSGIYGGGGGGALGGGGAVFNDGGTFVAEGVTFNNNSVTGGAGGSVTFTGEAGVRGGGGGGLAGPGQSGSAGGAGGSEGGGNGGSTSDNGGSGNGFGGGGGGGAGDFSPIQGGGAGGFGGGAGGGASNNNAAGGNGGTGYGGAIFSSGGSVTLINDTLTGNSATGGAGGTGTGGNNGAVGAGNGGAVFVNNTNFTAIFDTFSANTVTNGDSTSGTGSDITVSTIFSSTTFDATLINDILGQSGSSAVTDFLLLNYEAPLPDVTSSSHDFISNYPDGGGLPNGAVVGTGNPKLGPLSNNGGPTETMAFLTGSPVIEAGVATDYPDSDTLISTDQRGDARPVTPSIGSFDGMVVTPTSIPAALVGSVYSQQFTTTGGSGSGYTYTATGLPPGLSISTSGLLSGTPTSFAGSPYDVEVTVTDSSSETTTIDYSLTVYPALTITPQVLPSPTVGNSYTQQLISSGGSGPDYTFSSTALPPGLTLSQSGLISGTPTALSGSVYTVTVTLTDGDDDTSSVVYVLTVKQISQAGALTASTPQAYYGQPVTLTGNFSATAVGSSPMTGTVAFYDGSIYLGTSPLVASSAPQVAALAPQDASPQAYGQAVLPTTALNVGYHDIRRGSAGHDERHALIGD
jgi:hypothetical protein